MEFNTPLVRLDVNTSEAYRKAMGIFPDPRMEESGHRPVEVPCLS